MKSKLSHYPYARPQYEWDEIRLEETFGEYYEPYEDVEENVVEKGHYALRTPTDEELNNKGIKIVNEIGEDWTNKERKNTDSKKVREYDDYEIDDFAILDGKPYTGLGYKAHWRTYNPEDSFELKLYRIKDDMIVWPFVDRDIFISWKDQVQDWIDMGPRDDGYYIYHTYKGSSIRWQNWIVTDEKTGEKWEEKIDITKTNTLSKNVVMRIEFRYHNGEIEYRDLPYNSEWWFRDPSIINTETIIPEYREDLKYYVNDETVNYRVYEAKKNYHVFNIEPFATKESDGYIGNQLDLTKICVGKEIGQFKWKQLDNDNIYYIGSAHGEPSQDELVTKLVIKSGDELVRTQQFESYEIYPDPASFVLLIAYKESLQYKEPAYKLSTLNPWDYTPAPLLREGAVRKHFNELDYLKKEETFRQTYYPINIEIHNFYWIPKTTRYVFDKEVELRNYGNLVVEGNKYTFDKQWEIIDGDEHIPFGPYEWIVEENSSFNWNMRYFLTWPNTDTVYIGFRVKPEKIDNYWTISSSSGVLGRIQSYVKNIPTYDFETSDKYWYTNDKWQNISSYLEESKITSQMKDLLTLISAVLIPDNLIDVLKDKYEIVDNPSLKKYFLDDSKVYFHYDDKDAIYFHKTKDYIDLSNINLFTDYSPEQRTYMLYDNQGPDCVLLKGPNQTWTILNDQGDILIKRWPSRVTFYKHIEKDTNYKCVIYYEIWDEYWLREYGYPHIEVRRPREFNMKVGHYDEMEVIDYIYHDKNNYLTHEDILDPENLTIQRYMDLATTIANQLELGPEELLNNVSYTKTINDGDSIDFTTIASASITAQLNYPVEEANKLVGQNFTYLLDYGDGEWHNMGLFTIDEAESIDTYTSRITGHDHMYRLNKYVDDFIANYKYPTTLKQLWYDLLDYCDIFHDKEEISGVNADLVLNRNFEAVKTSALQIAEYITQLMAGYAHINKDNFSATISHYENSIASVMPSNYTDISHSPYDSQVPNQIKMGYNNDKTVSTSEPIWRKYLDNDVPCVVEDKTEYKDVVDSITYRYPDGFELEVAVSDTIEREYTTRNLDNTPLGYNIYDNTLTKDMRCFGMINVPGETHSFLMTFNEIVGYNEAIAIIREYKNTEVMPEKAKAVYYPNPEEYIDREHPINYYDADGRLFATWCLNDSVGTPWHKPYSGPYVVIYDKPEDLEEVSHTTHKEIDEYHYDFKVKDYTYRVDGKPLEEINEEIDTGKYVISIKDGNPTAKEYVERPDTKFIPYYITDNSLITYNIDEDECKRIMANICGVLKELPLDYRKCDLKMLTPTANYEIKIGDIIEATNKLGKKFKMMVMEISIDGSGITYKSFGEAQYPVEGENINSQIIFLNDLQNQVDNIRGDGQETKQELVHISATQTELVNAVNSLNQETIDLGENLVAVDEKYQEITNQITSDHDTDILAVYDAIDAKAEEVKGYADNKDAEVLKTAKKYADDQDTTNLQAAKDYADTIKSLIPTGTTMYVDVQDTGISCTMWIGDADKRSGVKFEYWYKSNPVFINVNFYFNGERVPFTEQIRPGE